MSTHSEQQQGAYASCCVLSFERPEFLRTAIRTLVENAGVPLELIVHDDGSSMDSDVPELISELLDDGWISTLIANPPGHNQGVGEAVRRMFAVATGDLLIKIDQDLIFEPGWLRVLYGAFYESGLEEESPALGALGGFHYHHDPVDAAKMHRRTWGAWEEVEDFVGSLIAVPRGIYESFGPFPTGSAAFAEDVEFKRRLQAEGLALGLPLTDIVRNQGFGVGPSTVVTAPDTVREIHQGPVVHRDR